MTLDSKIFKAKTKFSNIVIKRTQTSYELYSGDVIHSKVSIDKPHKLELKNLTALMGILLFTPKPSNILILGTAGGSLIHFFQRYYQDCRLTSVEIDAELLELMHSHMHLPRADDRLTYVIDDAGQYLQHCQQKFDLVIVDLFINNHSPRWLLNTESMKTINRCLSDQGGVAYNLMISSEHEFNHYYRDLRQIFNRRTLCLPVADLDNTLAFAFRYAVPERDMTWYMQNAQQLGEAHDINYMEILSTIYTTNPGGSGVI